MSGCHQKPAGRRGTDSPLEASEGSTLPTAGFSLRPQDWEGHISAAPAPSVCPSALVALASWHHGEGRKAGRARGDAREAGLRQPCGWAAGGMLGPPWASLPAPRWPSTTERAFKTQPRDCVRALGPMSSGCLSLCSSHFHVACLEHGGTGMTTPGLSISPGAGKEQRKLRVSRETQAQGFRCTLFVSEFWPRPHSPRETGSCLLMQDSLSAYESALRPSACHRPGDHRRRGWGGGAALDRWGAALQCGSCCGVRGCFSPFASYCPHHTPSETLALVSTERLTGALWSWRDTGTDT